MARFGEGDLHITDHETEYVDHGMRICSQCQQIIMENQMASHRQNHASENIQFSVLLSRKDN
ncbi:MAG: hypothetical protein U1A25_02920 [Candidatus Sungbacteria bacterium]|nr:hypothetical protein [bacterium]MDZ4260595.1 hypothetical protein [Candidatus Sungbacteria bacterium]